MNKWEIAAWFFAFIAIGITAFRLIKLIYELWKDGK